MGLPGRGDAPARYRDPVDGCQQVGGTDRLGLEVIHAGCEAALAILFPGARRQGTASDDKTARLRDSATGKPLGPPLQHQRAVFVAAFSPDGKSVVTASHEITARLWDSATGKPLGPPLQHQDWVVAAAFNPDGKSVVTASGHAARLWDSATGKPLGPPLQHQWTVRAAAFMTHPQRADRLKQERGLRCRLSWTSKHKIDCRLSTEPTPRRKPWSFAVG